MPGANDLGFDLLPPDPGLISPDLALDAAVAPVVDLAPTEPLPLGKGWSFDFVNKRFNRNGSTPAEVYELDHLRVWIEATLRTARHAHPIYGDDYGLEQPYDLLGQPFDGQLIAAYQEAVVDALMVHDRIAAVDGFLFQQDPSDDALYVSFTVTLDGEEEQEIVVDGLRLTPTFEFPGAV